MSMLVPDFWAEGRAQSRTRQRQITLRRFGWSTTSQDDAQRMADERAQQALDRALAGERQARRDPKVPYNGAQGVPIREQVVSRHGEEVITRNSYGALCLNTPRVLIADVDYGDLPRSDWFNFYLGLLLLLAAAGGATVVHYVTWHSGWSVQWNELQWQLLLMGGAFIGGGLGWALVEGIELVRERFQRRSEARLPELAKQRIDDFAAAHPDWGLRVYQTPAGLRLIATHRLFKPDEPAVADFFSAVQADPVYVAMCRHQKCFRARLTGKPWRMGMDAHIRPRGAVWPVAPDRMAERDAWLAAYDARVLSFAACRFDKALGPPLMSLDVAPVVQLHDSAAQALKPDMPLA